MRQDLACRVAYCRVANCRVAYAARPSMPCCLLRLTNLSLIQVLAHECWPYLRQFDQELRRFNESYPAYALLEMCGPSCHWPCTYKLADPPVQRHQPTDSEPEIRSRYSTKRFLAWPDRVLATSAFWSMSSLDLPLAPQSRSQGEGGRVHEARLRAAEAKYGVICMDGIADHDAVFLLAPI